MRAASYIEIAAYMRCHPHVMRALRFIDHLLVGVVATAYIALIIYLVAQNDSRLFKVILVPGTSFLLVSVVRTLINAPRPYEIIDLEPTIDKRTRGHSFPSRHTFSATIISMTLFYILPAFAVIYIMVPLAIGVVRIMSGVHFLRDIVGGLLLGIACGIMGFWII